MVMKLFLLFLVCEIIFVNSVKRRTKASQKAFYSNDEVPDELMKASYIADVHRVEYLLDLDPDIISSEPPVFVNRIESQHKRTSLIVCGLDPQTDEREQLDKDCLDIAKMLYKAGADLHYQDKYGWNALAMGAIRGMTRYCEFLIGKNVSIDSMDNQNRTALMKAVAHAQLPTARILIESGASLSLKDLNGLTALHHAVLLASNNESYIPFFQEILSHYNLSLIEGLVDYHGRNALMYATIEGSIEVCRILLEKGCDPRRVDNFQLSVTQMPRDPVLRELLLNKSIDFVEKEHGMWMEAIDLNGNGVS